MHPTPTSGSTRQTLAARESEARVALGRLRTCSRKIALISAVAGATGLGPGRDRVRRPPRALSTEAARLHQTGWTGLVADMIIRLSRAREEGAG